MHLVRCFTVSPPAISKIFEGFLFCGLWVLFVLFGGLFLLFWVFVCLFVCLFMFLSRFRDQYSSMRSSMRS